MSHTLHPCYSVEEDPFGKWEMAQSNALSHGQTTVCKKQMREFLQASHTLGQR